MRGKTLWGRRLGCVCSIFFVLFFTSKVLSHSGVGEAKDPYHSFRQELSDLLASEVFQNYQEEIAAESRLYGLFYNFSEEREEKYLEEIESLATTYMEALEDLSVVETALALRSFRDQFGRTAGYFSDARDASAYVRAYDYMMDSILRHARFHLGARVAPELNGAHYADLCEIGEWAERWLHAYMAHERLRLSDKDAFGYLIPPKDLSRYRDQSQEDYNRHVKAYAEKIERTRKDFQREYENGDEIFTQWVGDITKKDILAFLDTPANHSQQQEKARRKAILEGYAVAGLKLGQWFASLSPTRWLSEKTVGFDATMIADISLSEWLEKHQTGRAEAMARMEYEGHRSVEGNENIPIWTAAQREYEDFEGYAGVGVLSIPANLVELLLDFEKDAPKAMDNLFYGVGSILEHFLALKPGTIWDSAKFVLKVEGARSIEGPVFDPEYFHPGKGGAGLVVVIVTGKAIQNVLPKMIRVQAGESGAAGIRGLSDLQNYPVVDHPGGLSVAFNVGPRGSGFFSPRGGAGILSQAGRTAVLSPTRVLPKATSPTVSGGLQAGGGIGTVVAGMPGIQKQLAEAEALAEPNTSPAFGLDGELGVETEAPTMVADADGGANQRNGTGGAPPIQGEESDPNVTGYNLRASNGNNAPNLGPLGAPDPKFGENDEDEIFTFPRAWLAGEKVRTEDLNKLQGRFFFQDADLESSLYALGFRGTKDVIIFGIGNDGYFRKFNPKTFDPQAVKIKLDYVSVGRVHRNDMGLEVYAFLHNPMTKTMEDWVWVGSGNLKNVFLNSDGKIVKEPILSEVVGAAAAAIIQEENAVTALLNEIKPGLLPRVYPGQVGRMMTEPRFGHEINLALVAESISLMASGAVEKILKHIRDLEEVGIIYGDDVLHNCVINQEGELELIEAGAVYISETSPYLKEWRQIAIEYGTDAETIIQSEEDFKKALGQTRNAYTAVVEQLVNEGAPIDLFLTDENPAGPHAALNELLKSPTQTKVWLTSLLAELQRQATGVEKTVDLEEARRVLLYLILLPYVTIDNQAYGVQETLDTFLRTGTLTREGVDRKLLSLTFWILETGQVKALVNEGVVEFAPRDELKKVG